jgi:hypothetical protein
MSLLQNRWVVGGLGVGAIAVVSFNLYRQLRPQRVKRPPSPAAAALTTPTVKPGAKPGASPVAASGGAQLDYGHFTTKLADWVATPPPDPFSPPALPPAEAPQGPAAAAVLKLQGTWRQTGGFVAVINRQAVTEKEVVDGFTVQQIEADRVFVSSLRGVEEITFPGTSVAPPPRRVATGGR